jgi:hypothetical protein
VRIDFSGFFKLVCVALMRFIAAAAIILLNNLWLYQEKQPNSAA